MEGEGGSVEERRRKGRKRGREKGESRKRWGEVWKRWGREKGEGRDRRGKRGEIKGGRE